MPDGFICNRKQPRWLISLVLLLCCTWSLIVSGKKCAILDFSGLQFLIFCTLETMHETYFNCPQCLETRLLNPVSCPSPLTHAHNFGDEMRRKQHPMKAPTITTCGTLLSICATLAAASMMFVRTKEGEDCHRLIACRQSKPCPGIAAAEKGNGHGTDCCREYTRKHISVHNIFRVQKSEFEAIN